MANVGRNLVYNECWSAGTVHKPAQQSRKSVPRASCPILDTVGVRDICQ